jgi:hypothetical protein
MKIAISVLVVIAFAGLLWLSPSANSHPGLKTVATNLAASDSTINWDKMDHDARKAYMKQVVFPAMKTEFAKFDPKKFGNMKCTTCHGDGALDDSYKMPNPKIFKLPSTKEGWAKADTNFMKFMMKTVKPKMAGLLGMKQYDMKTKTGFGCGNCHTDEK